MPRIKNMVSTTYGNSDVKYTTCKMETKLETAENSQYAIKPAEIVSATMVFGFDFAFINNYFLHAEKKIFVKNSTNLHCLNFECLS